MVDETLMDGIQLSSTLDGLADAITDMIDGDIALVGIVTGGAHLAARLVGRLHERGNHAIPLGTMDITLYRDDLYTGLERPVLGETDIPFDIAGKGIILVDDVLFTGRTVRAALNQLMDYGRPRWVKLVVLVDRGHRELPIAADAVGVVVKTGKQDRVQVSLTEVGALTDGVVVVCQEQSQ